jgi:hypothetical protein
MVSVHEYISFPDNSGWNLTLGDTQSLELDFIEEGGGELAELITTADDILSPMSDYSDWWIFHSTKKNSQGEPLLCLFSHESCDIEEEVDCNAGELFLQKVAEQLENVVSDVEEEKPDEENIEEALIANGGGFTGTLIKQECDFALYVKKKKGRSSFPMLYLYPDGRKVNHNCWDNDELPDYTKKMIIEVMKVNEQWGEKKPWGYTVFSDGKQVESTQSGDRIETTQSNQIMGWSREGDLISVEKFSSGLQILTFKYIGYVKDGKVVFSDDCGIAEE